MTTNPETFDIESWLKDAALPEESAVVYKRPDVLAELTDLKHRIELERKIDAEERTSADASKAKKLEAEYEKLLQVFSDSAITVYVQAQSEDRLQELREQNAKTFKDLDEDAARVASGYVFIAASIVAVKPANGERIPATFTPEALKALEKAIGVPQVQLITVARQKAQNLVPEVDADFLHKRSGINAGSQG